MVHQCTYVWIVLIAGILAGIGHSGCKQDLFDSRSDIQGELLFIDGYYDLFHVPIILEQQWANKSKALFIRMCYTSVFPTKD